LTDERATPADAVVRLSAGDPEREALAAGRVSVVISGEPVEVQLVVQAGPVAVEQVLPIFQGLSNLFVDRAVARAEAEGRTVSCRAGCGACCRQLVPVAEAEARALAHLVDAMPEPRQAHVRRRFDEALNALTTADLLDRVSQQVENGAVDLGLDYFRAGVACPFLEDEACSIHADRPLACREYLVTSPAQNCQSPSAEGIEMVKLEGDPSLALLKAERTAGWTPLVLALRYAEQAPPAPRDRTGPQILADVIGRL
jgi:Fe-S-cluster containining protein